MSVRRIALVAGEASGDNLGAGLIEQLRQQWPDAEFAGIGGPAMHKAGCDIWWEAEELAVMGLAEILRHLPRLLRLRRQLRQRVLDWQPDVFIGIDAPEFNLGVERWLKKRGICTVHYVSPSVWAWRRKRAQKMRANADLVLCLFPMEPPIYAQYGVNAQFVGHPLADKLSIYLEYDVNDLKIRARRTLGLGLTPPTLAVLPGSRMGEVSRLAPVFLQAAKQVSEKMSQLGPQYSRLSVLIPAANERCERFIEEQIKALDLPINPISQSTQWHVFKGDDANSVITAADVVLVASGTATLETMLIKRPMVVGYKVAELTYRIVKALGLIKIKRYALPNILAERDLAPEFIQHDCTAENLAAAVLHWFEHPEHVEALQSDYLHLHHKLRQNASAQAAAAVVELLAKRS